MATRPEGIIIEPTNSSLELLCDPDFSGYWKAETAHLDRTIEKSRTEYVVKYAA